VQAPHGVTTSFRHTSAPAWGPLHGLQVDISSTVNLHGLQGDSLPHHGLHHRLQGKSLCSGACSTSSPSFFTALGICRVASLTWSHSSLSSATSWQVFFPLLEYVTTEVLPSSLTGLALTSGESVLELAGIGSIRHGGSFLQLLTEATSIAPPTSKFLPHKPTTPSYFRVSLYTSTIYASQPQQLGIFFPKFHYLFYKKILSPLSVSCFKPCG